ncbi:MAG: hypothetical protein Hens3KO_28880 [Henriciella sp.]
MTIGADASGLADGAVLVSGAEPPQAVSAIAPAATSVLVSQRRDTLWGANVNFILSNSAGV